MWCAYEAGSGGTEPFDGDEYRGSARTEFTSDNEGGNEVEAFSWLSDRMH
jgi:hypothetical protein